MTDTVAELANAAFRVDLEARCEALLQCAEQCCDPMPCEALAVARVSFHCDSPECDRASHVLLLCDDCADQAADCVPPPTRRPL
jgi:hypothetical protein